MAAGRLAHPYPCSWLRHLCRRVVHRLTSCGLARKRHHAALDQERSSGRKKCESPRRAKYQSLLTLRSLPRMKTPPAPIPYCERIHPAKEIRRRTRFAEIPKYACRHDWFAPLSSANVCRRISSSPARSDAICRPRVGDEHKVASLFRCRAAAITDLRR